MHPIDASTPANVDELEEVLSRPTEALVAAMANLQGDILVLGAGGKMGPTLARMARRASDEAGVTRRVIGVSRFSSPGVEQRLNTQNVETIRCDLLDRAAIDRLPDAENIVFMAGMKFGATDNPSLTWAMNCHLPALVSERFRHSRLAAFSSGNVYGMTSTAGRGSVETDTLAPIGEYASTVLGRERMLEHFSRQNETPMVLLRLNYAVELRYGVLVDLAKKVLAGEPIDVSMGSANVIWQAEANALALQSLLLAACPPRVLNIAGPEFFQIRTASEQLGDLLDKPVQFTGAESGEAFLSNAEASYQLFHRPCVTVEQMIRWTADWVSRGGDDLGKPTHFRKSRRKVLNDAMDAKSQKNVSSPAGATTNVRFMVVGTTALMSVLLYLDRFCISFAEVFIKEDLGLSDEQIGVMLGAFFWTYAFGQVPAGWLTDRFGSRIMLSMFVLFWSLFTGLTGLAIGFSMLLLLRFGFGFAQAGAYPTGANIVSKWVPFEWRGTASSIVSTGGRVGGFLALSATGFVIVWLTPASTPAQLGAGDLLDGHRLCRELAGVDKLAAPADQFAQHVLAGLADSEQALVRKVASAKTASAVDLDVVADALNRVIDQPDFFPDAMLERLSLEREAVRVLAADPAGRTMEQSQRVNRLAFEAVHPDSIKKIYNAGWRPMMFAYGAIGILVAGLIWITCRDRPDQHPRCNAEEVALINRDPRMSAHVVSRVTRVPLLRLIGSFSMWCSCVSQFCTNVGWVFVMTWAPRFFQEVHQVPVETRALMVAIPPLFGMAGMFLGGPLTDCLIRPCGLRWGRALPLSLTRFPAMAAYLVCLTHPSAWTAALMFAMVSFFTGLGTSSSWAFCQDVGGKQVGSVLGWGNMWGNLGAAVAPSLMIFLVRGEDNWDVAFMVCAAAFFVSGIVALGINATIPIADIDDASSETTLSK